MNISQQEGKGANFFCVYSNKVKRCFVHCLNNKNILNRDVFFLPHPPKNKHHEHRLQLEADAK